MTLLYLLLGIEVFLVILFTAIFIRKIVKLLENDEKDTQVEKNPKSR